MNSSFRFAFSLRSVSQFWTSDPSTPPTPRAPRAVTQSIALQPEIKRGSRRGRLKSDDKCKLPSLRAGPSVDVVKADPRSKAKPGQRADRVPALRATAFVDRHFLRASS